MEFRSTFSQTMGVKFSLEKAEEQNSHNYSWNIACVLQIVIPDGLYVLPSNTKCYTACFHANINQTFIRDCLNHRFIWI